MGYTSFDANFEIILKDIETIGESPSICPVLKNNGAKAPKGPIPIIVQEWTDTKTFSDLNTTQPKYNVF